MKPLNHSELRGTWATLLLPINEDESVDFARLRDQIDFLLTTGIDGIYSNGTAAEFYAQSEEEFDRIHELLAERCERANMPFQIGATHTSAQTALDRLRRAAHLKPSAFQVIIPDWYPLGDLEVISFLERMAEAAAPVGLVLYNPPHAKRVIGPVTYKAISQSAPEVIGVKIAPADKASFDAVRQAAPKLSIFVPGHHLATGHTWGAEGSYSNVACLQPAGAARWHRLMSRDIAAALALETRILDFLKRHIIPLDYCNAAKDKLLAAIGNWTPAGTRLRWPYRYVPESEAERLRPLAREALPELFEGEPQT